MLAAPMKNGIIFDIKKYSVHDGPGIRTTVFFKGCPLRCWWCHNPEGQDSKPELVYRKTRCTGCGECVKSCPQSAIQQAARCMNLNRDRCVVCGECSQACPSDALSIAGRRITVRDVLEEIEKDEAFYDESGGGVTLSGGEPLLQPDFLNALLVKCRERGIHTTVDTCGFAQYKIISSIRENVDLFLYDVKIMDDKKHMKYTGGSNRQILRNLSKLSKSGSAIVISFPVIPGINDDDENVTRTAEFIRSLPSIDHINLLPYHRAGIEKYRSLGKPYRLENIRSPSDQEIKLVKQKMEAFGIRVGIGGD